MSKEALRPLRFEPHAGFGSNDPEGNPWPFGYITADQPVFELNVILEHDHAALMRFGRLFAASPDHALVAWAFCNGARWEPDTREFCISGIRYSTKLDEFGVPTMTPGMRTAILTKAYGVA